MKLKRIFQTVGCMFLMCTMLLSLFACGQVDAPEGEESTAPAVKKILTGYRALDITEASDGMDPVRHVMEYTSLATNQTDSVQDASAPAQMTVTFQGKSYTGEYDYSICQFPETHKRHKYDGDHILFDIHAQTGKLLYFLRTDADAFDQRFVVGDEQCLELAKAAAREYIAVDDYQYEVSKDDELGNHRYTVRFYREIGGYRTNDNLVITINGNGEVVAMSQTMLGSFDGVSSFELGAQAAETMLDAKVDGLYRDIENYLDYEIRTVRLITLEDGSRALYYLIDVSFDAGNEEGEALQYRSAVRMLIAPVYEEVTE